MEKSQKVTVQNQPPALPNTEKRNHSMFWGPESQTDPVRPGKDLSRCSTASFSTETLAFKIQVIFEEC